MCETRPERATAQFRDTRERVGTGRSKVLAQHLIQSFAPDEVTPEQAMKIGEELCHRLLQDQYQYVIATHIDHDHIHNHIVFNNINMFSGFTFETEHNQGKKSERAWAEIQKLSDEICLENGLSVITEKKNKGVSHYERDAQKSGISWKEKLRQKIAEIALESRNFEDFLQRCTANGIEYVYKPTYKYKLKFRLQGQERYVRGETLGEYYSADMLAEQIEQIQKSRSVLDRLAEKKNAEKPVAPPTPVVTPKTEPTQTTTAPTKPTEYGHLITNALLEKMKERGISQAPAPKPTADKTETPKSEYAYKPTSDEEFFNAFGVHLDETDTPDTTEQTESQAPEAPEVDPWEEIRSMRNADEMIANLEAGGITSLNDLKEFFWNVSHPDDHTDELAKLKAKIDPIDKLIKMMKQRTKHTDTYNEYQGRSVLTQSHYRKKNAAAIDAYEEADKYITEHIKAYYIKGKPPKQSDLQAKSDKLKAEYDALVPEHNAFLKRKSAASQYVKQVRGYLENKRQQERNRQYQERKRTQQRKKDTLE